MGTSSVGAVIRLGVGDDGFVLCQLIGPWKI